MRALLMFLVLLLVGCQEKRPPEPIVRSWVYDKVVFANEYCPTVCPADATITAWTPTTPPPAAVTPTTPACVTRYYLVVETRMHSLSLSITKYIRNRMGATTVTLPVDEKAYFSTRVGQTLDSSFDGLGLALRGRVQEVRSTVKNKYTRCF